MKISKWLCLSKGHRKQVLLACIQYLILQRVNLEIYDVAIFLFLDVTATSHIHLYIEKHLPGVGPPISEKMTFYDGLKPASIKKSTQARGKFNQFVVKKGVGPDNPRSTTVSTKLNAGSIDGILQAVENTQDVFQRVRIYRVLKRKVGVESANCLELVIKSRHSLQMTE